MKADVVIKDCWIMRQLAGIQILEQELTYAFKTPGARTSKDLRRRIAQLNSWLNIVDDALTVRRHKTDIRTAASQGPRPTAKLEADCKAT
jgi:hypothetical protein